MRIQFNYSAVIFAAMTATCGLAFSQTDAQISDFVKASKFNDLSAVRNLVSKGVSPNTTDSVGDPMLNIAIRDKSYDVINYLIANEATDVDLSNKSGETPLMIASINGDLAVVRILVEQRKAEINHIGWTPLHYACSRGHLDIASYLIAKGANIDSLSQSNTTPLMMAVSSGNESLVKLLLDKGANLRSRNDQGLTAIDIAYIYEKPWIAEGLSSRWAKLYKKPYVGPKGLGPSKS
jgi:ankyrin repeat protein